MSPRFARIRPLAALALVGIVSLAAAPKTKTDLAQTNKASMDAFWNQEYKSAEEMAGQIDAWEEDRNEREVGVNWRFTTADARVKLSKLYPTI